MVVALRILKTVQHLKTGSCQHRYGSFGTYVNLQHPHIHTWLVVLTILKNMSSSVGMMNFPYIMESHKSHVPNHQPETTTTEMLKPSKGDDSRTICPGGLERHELGHWVKANIYKTPSGWWF